jgi:hypothetical protein
MNQLPRTPCRDHRQKSRDRGACTLISAVYREARLVQSGAMSSVAVDKKARKKAEKAAAAEADAAPVKKAKKAKRAKEAGAEEQHEHKVKKKKRKAEDAGTAADGAAAAPRKAKKAKKQVPSPAASDSAASVQSGLQLAAAAAPPPAAEGPGARRSLPLAARAARAPRACERCGDPSYKPLHDGCPELQRVCAAKDALALLHERLVAACRRGKGCAGGGPAGAGQLPAGGRHQGPAARQGHRRAVPHPGADAALRARRR